MVSGHYKRVHHAVCVRLQETRLPACPGTRLETPPPSRALSLASHLWTAVAHGNDGSAAAALGADDIMPFLIYTIVSANAPNLYSNLRFVDRFRHQERLQGEGGYYLTSMVFATQPRATRADAAIFACYWLTTSRSCSSALFTTSVTRCI